MQLASVSFELNISTCSLIELESTTTRLYFDRSGREKRDERLPSVPLNISRSHVGEYNVPIPQGAQMSPFSASEADERFRQGHRLEVILTLGQQLAVCSLGILALCISSCFAGTSGHSTPPRSGQGCHGWCVRCIGDEGKDGAVCRNWNDASQLSCQLRKECSRGQSI